MDRWEWGVVTVGLALTGFGLSVLLATAGGALLVVGCVLIVVGLLLTAGAVCGYPLFTRLSPAAVEEARRRGHLPEIVAGPPPVNLDVATRFLATELKTIRRSVQRLRSEGKFPRGVTPLPTLRWVELESVVAGRAPELYASASDAYSRTQEFNRMAVDRANLYVGRWLSFHPDDDIDGFLCSLDVAIQALEQ